MTVRLTQKGRAETISLLPRSKQAFVRDTIVRVSSLLSRGRVIRESKEIQSSLVRFLLLAVADKTTISEAGTYWRFTIIAEIKCRDGTFNLRIFKRLAKPENCFL